MAVAAILSVIAAALGGNGAPLSAGDAAPGAPATRDATGIVADDGSDPLDDRAAGAVPEGVTVFDDDQPAVANLDADLLAAVRRAARDAADDDVTLYVNSGWRSAGYQDALLRDAIARYGSAAEAARWVATADTSPHVDGDAIDIGPWDARDWFAQHGAEYGLCQIYANEPWHYELRPDAVSDGCPPAYADPTHDPRMHR